MISYFHLIIFSFMLKCYSASSQIISHCGNENDLVNFSLQGGGFDHCDEPFMTAIAIFNIEF